MKEKFPFLPMVVYPFIRRSRRLIVIAIVLYSLPGVLSAQLGEGLVMATCGHAYAEAEQSVMVAYQLQPSGELSDVYGENVTFDQLGSVFGIAMDKRGDYYITAGGLYGAGSNLNFRTHGSNDSPTMIYKVDGESIKHGKDWKITDLVVAGDFEVGNNTIPNPQMCGTRRAGLGNIAYNSFHDLFYITNLSDGRIYQMNAAGKVLNAFDPSFDGKSFRDYYGYAPLGQRALAVAVKYPVKNQADKLMLYYSRWSEDVNNNLAINNEIWAVELDPQNGEIVPNTERKMKTMESPRAVPSAPIADIEFDRESQQMLLTERRMKSYHSYLAMEAWVGDALELQLEKSDWKKVDNELITSNKVAYGLSAKTPKRFAPDELTIIDLNEIVALDEKSVIGDVDFNALRKKSEEAALTVDVYPNPTAGLVQIESKFKNAKYLLLNNSGQVLQKGKLNGQSHVLDLSSMSNGTYMISIISGDKVYNKKINKMD